MFLSLLSPSLIVAPKHSIVNPNPVISDIVMNSYNLESTIE